MVFTVKGFAELTGRELHDIYQLRAEVFVVEQDCAYQDVDGKDPKCLHVLSYEGESLIAYSRLLPPGVSYPEASIGRVVVKKDWRRNGAGRSLTKFCVDEALKRFSSDQIVISAQCYLEKFYSDFGFVPEGEEYLEDDIPHVKMRKRC